MQFEVDGQPYGSPVALDDTGTASLSLSTIDAGTHTITAVYEGEGQDSPFESGDADETLVVMPGSQTINFGPLSSVSYGVAPIVLDASASSGLVVSYSIISGPGTLDGSTLTITGAGTITIEADQAGDNDYLAAPSVQQSLQVTPAILTVTSIAAVSPDRATTPVSTIDVAFNVPINSDSAPADGVTLTDHGNPVASSGLSFTLVPGTTSTYQIGGLSGLTAAPGTYVFTVNAANIDDQSGNAGLGSLSTSWVVIPTSVYVSASYATDAPGTAVTWTDGTDHFTGVDAFGTIQAGINAVAAGGTVNLGAGSFSEQLTIDQSLSLVGAGTSSTTIEPPSMESGNEIEIASGAAVTISDVTLAGANSSTAIDVSGGSLSAEQHCHHRLWRRCLGRERRLGHDH